MSSSSLAPVMVHQVFVANTGLEGTYSELYPEVPQDKEGMRRLFRQFSSLVEFQDHAAPETPARSTKAANSAIALACLSSGVRRP